MNKDNYLWPEDATYGDLYDPAMEVKTKEEALAYLDRIVRYQKAISGHKNIDLVGLKKNIGYWAGYRDHETRERVERLFECEHPAFGAIKDVPPPTPGEALLLGINRGSGKGPQTLIQLRGILALSFEVVPASSVFP